MKACPICGRMYPGDARFCPEDGTSLQRASEVPIAGDGLDARIGQVMCGRYQIRRVVADGGMGRVYEALDLSQRRHVALKILHPEVVSDDVALERFKREFEVSRQLPHHHIVEVIDFQATHDGSYALVMEFLYGEELRATLKRERVLSPERLVRVVAQVAAALDEAHNRRFVHRDLKPDNLFLCQTTDGDIVKILDFGSVKDKTTTAKKLTVLGTTIGSPFYMAPEQAQGLETLDHRADVWALAAIIYECVTGRVPFQGNNGPSILLEILTKEPVAPSRAAVGEVPPVPVTLDRVLAAAFRKQPAERIPTVGALADAVGEAYGLAGSHREWAHTPQATLAERIRARLPELLAAGSSAHTADDDFFGATGNLEVMGDPFAAPGSPHRGGVPSGGEQAPWAAVPSADEALVVPTRPATMGIVVAILVGLGALGLGIVVAWTLLGR